MYIYVKSVINRFINHRYYIHLQSTATPPPTAFCLAWLEFGHLASSFCWLVFGFLIFFFPSSLPGVHSEPQTDSQGTSFTFPQNHIDNAAEKGQREGHPGQDVGEAVGVGVGVGDGMPFGVPHRVDGCRAHHAYTSKDLEDSSDVKAASFGEGEKLAEEQEQRQDAENDGQDHGGLDGLQPFICR